MFCFKGISQRTIAEERNIPLSTIKGRIRLALKHLKGHLTAGKRGGSGEVQAGTLKTDESGTGAVSYTIPTDDAWQMIIVHLEPTPESEQHPGDLVLAAEL